MTIRPTLGQVENIVDPDHGLNNVRNYVLSDDELRKRRDIFAREQCWAGVWLARWKKSGAALAWLAAWPRK